MIKRISEEFRPKRLLPSLAGGVVTGIITITVATAFAALIFTGEMVSYLPIVVGWALLGSVAHVLLTASFSSLPSTISSVQDSPAVVLAVMAATILKVFPASASVQEKFITIAVAVALGSILTGVLFFLLGQFKLGDLIRYIPYPVIGGFLAGSGLLLIFGSISVMTGVNAGPAQILELFQPNLLFKWLPGMLYAVFLMFILRRIHHALVLPGSLVAGIVLFYIILLVAGISIAEAKSQGWLLGTSTTAGSSLLRPLGWPGGETSLSHVNWSIVFGNTANLIVVALVGVITLLLNATGIELDTHENLDFNRELKAAGIANVVAGLVGCIPGAHALSDTMLVYKMGVKSRAAAVVLSIICLLAMFFGASLVSFFPTPVLGGLLMLLGLDFLFTWVYEAWFKLRLLDYAIIIAILVVMNTIGVLEGVALGLAMAVILFVIDYSRINIVRHTISGKHYQSKVSRPVAHEQLLRQKGDGIYILELQGYLFFGTANKLLNQISQYLAQNPNLQIRFIVLDFRLAAGLDSSGVLSFTKLKQLAEMKQAVLVFTQISPDTQSKLEKELFSDKSSETCRVFPDLDHGLEWCENQIIQRFTDENIDSKPLTLMAQLEKALPPAISHDQLLCYFEHVEIKTGEYFIHQGEPTAGMYFVETGLATVELEVGKEKRMRIRTLQPGTVVGEMGIYLGSETSASVYANQDTTLFRLSPARLVEMEENDPWVAVAFHKFVARVMSERLIDSTESIQALLS
jgi:SulP family sulfate permease